MIRIFFVLVCLLWIPVLALASDVDPQGRLAPAADKIRAAAYESTVGYDALCELCDDFGHRLSGTQTLERAIDWAAECGMSDRLHFKVGNHHEPLEYESGTFDGCYSFGAVWPFFKKEELDDHAREMYRVLKPGARYACSEYLLTPHFDWNNEEHVALHRSYLPTLAATQSMYPADVCAALDRAGFKIFTSAPSKGEAWPLCEQKRDLVTMGRKLVRALEAIRVLPTWVDESLDLLQKGGEAWTAAEKAKIADLNWRIIAEKPAG